MRVHLFALVFVAFAGWYFQISLGEWLALLVCFTLVPTLELVNSAIESSCDIIRDRLHLDYKETKLPRDLAAGAVLWSALGTVIIGLIIFLPRLILLANSTPSL